MHDREVTFTTLGRKSGKPYDLTIFVVTDGHGPGEPPRPSEQATFELIPAGS